MPGPGLSGLATNKSLALRGHGSCVVGYSNPGTISGYPSTVQNAESSRIDQGGELTTPISCPFLCNDHKMAQMRRPDWGPLYAVGHA